MQEGKKEWGKEGEREREGRTEGRMENERGRQWGGGLRTPYAKGATEQTAQWAEPWVKGIGPY